MSKHRILFYGCNKATENSELEVFESEKLIFIRTNHNDSIENFIALDKSTAIKFAKTLRTEINKIQE